jgi:hypothetical protein
MTLSVDLAFVRFIDLSGFRSLIDAITETSERSCPAWVTNAGPARHLASWAGLSDILASVSLNPDHDPGWIRATRRVALVAM